VLVTHDQEEALSMSDMVCVMNAGRIVQMAKPQDVYDTPADLFVADFVGKTNRILATVEADGATLRLSNGMALAAKSGLKPGIATVALRPEAIELTRQADGNAGALSGTVTHRIFLGSTAEYQISVDGLGDFLVTADRRSVQESDLVEPGERVVLNFNPGKVHVFPA
jgi:spermidine/putrescine transport system ATP-binding protein